ncbi:MAG: putative baseplate assembly protein [Blastocatellia bacterium]|nr:putative baseplate assembly protein [Blastocatellia bacterium]
MNNSLVCQKEERRETVRQKSHLHGFDYLEVVPEDKTQRTLRAVFLGKAPKQLDKTNLVIEGGRRIRGIRIVDEPRIERHKHEGLDDYVEIKVDRSGDFSNYTLRAVKKDKDGRLMPHPDFDPRYGQIEFNFKIDCASDLDCKSDCSCPPEARREPEIDYLARDFTSFRQLMLDRLAVVMPDWKERHEADLGITLVELLAYTGDYLSYFQDAVATEAYLDTARQRISVRRHARLVDYRLHEGCNARAWICVEVASDLSIDLREFYFVTSLREVRSDAPVALPATELLKLPAAAFEVFEPMGTGAAHFYESHNRIEFYAWGDKQCCLGKGTTRASLVGDLAVEPESAADPACPPEIESVVDVMAVAPPPMKEPTLHLRPGDVLLFEEIVGPETGSEADADPARRHAVRLTRVSANVDPVNGRKLVEIEWADEDALPFPLCLSAPGQPPDCTTIDPVSVARGNCILADHGASVWETLPPVETGEIVERCAGEGVLAETQVVPLRFKPVLRNGPLVFSEPLDSSAPAARAFQRDPHRALPQIHLTGTPPIAGDVRWTAEYDLLSSAGTAQHFVVETDNEGRAHLRFGDGELGRRPEAGMTFRADYRLGGGMAGNVGGEAIAHFVGRSGAIDGAIRNVRNPLPAVGGQMPQPMAEAKLFAPYAIRKDLQRAINPADYAAIVEREFASRVQRAAAQLRWTGSGYELFVAVDPYGLEEASPALLAEINDRLHRYRRIGHALRVIPARRVPLDLQMTISVKPFYLAGYVKGALLALFSNRAMADGKKGFFHPDNLTFGDGVFLSALVAAAFQVEGVENALVDRLQRMDEDWTNATASGVLAIQPFEIAQCDNDPSFPEHGRLILNVGGGR